jgi:hypothetical protein
VTPELGDSRMPIEIRILRIGDEAVLGNVASGLFDNPIDPGSLPSFWVTPDII